MVLPFDTGQQNQVLNAHFLAITTDWRTKTQLEEVRRLS